MKPVILVVDDSDIQRQLIGGLLKSACDYEICFAWDGQDACEFLDKSPADVVLTDLLMPGVDGLALIEQLRSCHADIAIALVTAHGNEELAGDALRRGAVNYIPKAELTERLVATVNQLVHRVQFDQRKLHIPKRIGGVEWEEKIATDLQLVEPLVDRVHCELIAASAGDRTDRLRTCIALSEALSNAILHGNLEVTRQDLVAMRSLHPDDALERILRERLAIPELAARQVTLRANVSNDRAVFSVSDQRSPSGPTQEIAVDTQDFLERGHARGLILMQSLTKQLIIEPATNEVTLVANLEGGGQLGSS